MEKIPKLPRELSELIKVALHDLELVEKDKRYRVHMNTWHAYSTIIDQCLVCFAGSVLAKTCKAPIRKFIALGGETSFHPLIAYKLYALDDVRLGLVGTALEKIGHALSDEDWKLFDFMREDEHWVDYSVDPEGFKLNMITLIGVLESEGL